MATTYYMCKQISYLDLLMQDCQWSYYRTKIYTYILIVRLTPMIPVRSFKPYGHNNHILCQEHVEETSIHLHWDCQFTLSCWDNIALNRHRGTSAFDDIIFLKQVFPPHIAIDIVIMGCWNIWMQRNGKIF